jgi:hypothetical protein
VIVYTSKATWVGDIEHTLVTSCSDPRFHEPTDEFVGVHLGLGRFDPLILPGGPAALLLSSPSFFAARDHVKLLHLLHGFKRVVGIAHGDRGYYRSRYP